MRPSTTCCDRSFLVYPTGSPEDTAAVAVGFPATLDEAASSVPSSGVRRAGPKSKGERIRASQPVTGGIATGGLSAALAEEKEGRSETSGIVSSTAGASRGGGDGDGDGSGVAQLAAAEQLPVKVRDECPYALHSLTTLDSGLALEPTADQS